MRYSHEYLGVRRTVHKDNTRWSVRRFIGTPYWRLVCGYIGSGTVTDTTQFMQTCRTGSRRSSPLRMPVSIAEIDNLADDGPGQETKDCFSRDTFQEQQTRENTHDGNHPWTERHSKGSWYITMSIAHLIQTRLQSNNLSTLSKIYHDHVHVDEDVRHQCGDRRGLTKKVDRTKASNHRTEHPYSSRWTSVFWE